MLVKRYEEAMLSIIACHLDSAARSRVSPEDVLQDGWADFFGHQRYRELQNGDALEPYLHSLAYKKGLEESRDQHRQCRDCHRKSSLDSLAAEGELWLDAGEIGPDLQVEGAELHALLLKELDENGREFMRLRLDGETCQAVGRLLNMDVRKVQREVEKVWHRLTR